MTLGVASQFGAAFDDRLRAARPDLQVVSLPRGAIAAPLAPGVEVLLATPLGAADLPPPTGWPWALRWIQLVSTGIDGYPRWLLETPSVTTARGTSAQPIADYVLACILQRALRLPERRVCAPAGWKMTPAPALAGSTLGLFGFGGIGRTLAPKALALGLAVRALRRSDTPFEVPGVERARDLADLLATSDHFVLAAASTPETQRVLDAAALGHARRGLHVINVARGGLLDQEALLAALDDGRVGWASLDVTEPEPLPEGHRLYTHPRVYLSPHTCAIGTQHRDALLAKVLAGLQAYERGEAPADPVDLARGY